MLRRSTPFALFLVSFVAIAPARAQAPGFERVLSAVTLDFDDDGGMDRAVLAQNDDAGADLSLYLSKDAPPGAPALALTKTDAAFSGGAWGQLPSLAVAGKGSLQLKSENDSIGRDRWSQTLTIVYRGGEFVIGGIAYAYRDTLDPRAAGSCDLNLLSGKGYRNGKPIEAKLAPPRLAEWSQDKLPKECQFGRS